MYKLLDSSFFTLRSSLFVLHLVLDSSLFTLRSSLTIGLFVLHFFSFVIYFFYLHDVLIKKKKTVKSVKILIFALSKPFCG